MLTSSSDSLWLLMRGFRSETAARFSIIRTKETSTQKSVLKSIHNWRLDLHSLLAHVPALRNWGLFFFGAERAFGLRLGWSFWRTFSPLVLQRWTGMRKKEERRSSLSCLFFVFFRLNLVLGSFPQLYLVRNAVLESRKDKESFVFGLEEFEDICTSLKSSIAINDVLQNTLRNMMNDLEQKMKM
jgi:hypothetical protein